MNVFVSRHARLLPSVLWLMFLAPLAAEDIGFVAVMKGQEFAQTSANIVALGEWRIWNETGEVQNEGEHQEPLHLFEVYAFGTALDSILSGSVTVPGNQLVPLVNDFRGDEFATEIGIENGYGTPLELDTARPDGTYTVQLQTKNQGTHITNLTLSGGAYPPVPLVTNFTALQSADAASPVTVQWSAMGGTAQDFIHVKVIQRGGVEDGTILWQSGMPGAPGALNGESTQVEIPAGTLQSGRDYQAEVMFVKTAYALPGPPLEIAGYYKLTGFRIRTAVPSGQPLGAEFLRANPKDIWSSPAAVDSAVAFHFSHPMSSNLAHISIAWTMDGGPLGGGTFNYQWTQGNTVLLCNFSTDLPQGREIGWTLNLDDFKDAAGFALSGSPSGSFRTSTDEASTPPDAGFISVFKTRYFIQDGSTPVADGRYEALIEVEGNAANRLKSATVTALANARSGPLYADPWDGTEYEAPGEYGSQADLDRFYPNGSYQFNLIGLADGVQSVTLDLGTTDLYPDAPTVTNHAALQAVDPDADCTITWDALSGWNNIFETIEPGDGLIEFEIVDGRDREVFYVDPFELQNGTGVVVPAGTLKPGKTYHGWLYFLRITDVDDTSYPDAMAVAAFESQTVFTIKTTGELLLPAVALQRIGTTARITANGGDPQESYLLEASSDMKRWTLLNVHWNDTASTYQYDDIDARYFKARFYRMGEYDFRQPAIPSVSIQGTVWSNSLHTTPVAGAVVGTSLDGRTTTTDAQGRFFLMTDTPWMGGSTPYTIRITSGAQTKDFGPWNWGDQPREQTFALD